MSNDDTTSRTPSEIDAVADAYVEKLAGLSPMTATALGVPGDDTRLDDFSPPGLDAVSALTESTLAQLDGLTPRDAVDEVTLDAMTERLGLDKEIADRGYLLGELNVIESPLQSIRAIFDLMPSADVDDWQNIAARMRDVPRAVHGYIESLDAGRRADRVAARRQVAECIKQANQIGAGDGFFAGLAAGADPTLPDTLRSELSGAASDAGLAYRELASYLESELSPVARESDAVGREEYALWSRYFIGAEVDLDETYQWGLDELARITAEQEEVARQIKPGAGVQEAMELLDADPARRLNSTAELQAWMQDLADTAVRELAGTHFDIPDPVRTIECKIAPTQDGGIYYTPPADGFSRPGRMWWSVPEGVTQFNAWRETTTVYHEGVPGHHLQCGQTVYRTELLNKWRRLACWVSGHGEGWALYAERLMAELGYLDDPADRMGMLDGQRLRAARVVIDIGVHLGKPAPEEWGGGTWDADKAWPFLQANANMDDEFLRFELLRYLGWPGQATSYKVGQRLWENIRDEARADAERAGREFDIKAFHRRALDVGSVGLDTLRRALS
ncbi:DUF885 domain-containing protein [Spelaeicoccus albus]|uniref:Uncharacterized protein (DUF885 family) n=1 Tax=Spelaeicoccus albus TaxID=1280376 RepID=A0A7Z0IHQ5_9MICO|nr:DUF885 domain-containing protein [Spelaeicoccus albus]NYI67908.1 uncharacterized protein (DUF885 family) [Spelaeicoccus albus]